MHANCIGSLPDTPAFNHSTTPTTLPPQPPPRAVGIPRLAAQTFLTLFSESGPRRVVTHKHDRDTSVNAGGRCASGVGGRPDCGSRNGCEVVTRTLEPNVAGSTAGTGQCTVLYTVLFCQFQPGAGLHITLATHCCYTRKKPALSITS